MTCSADGGPRLRADAERSRRRILDAARVVFAERGLGAGFDEIARVAGLGVGTVYRRFPDREDLVDVLLAESVEAVVELADVASDISDPWEALVWWAERSVEMRHQNRGLSQVLANGERGHERVGRARDRIEPAVGRLLGRAKEAGVLRPDVEPVDLGLITHLLSGLTSEGRPEVWRRYLQLFMDSLRPHGDGFVPLAVAPPTAREFAELSASL